MKAKNHTHYSIFHNMKARCLNSNRWNYKYYGGKGIQVCNRWTDKTNGFNNFVEDMGERPIGFQLDRIDVNGHYCKENCRWVNKYTQMGNTTKSNIVPGVGWHKQRQKYRARIKINGKDKSLGLYHTFEDAVVARKLAYEKLCIH